MQANQGNIDSEEIIQNFTKGLKEAAVIVVDKKENSKSV